MNYNTLQHFLKARVSQLCEDVEFVNYVKSGDTESAVVLATEFLDDIQDADDFIYCMRRAIRTALAQ